jgi:hypothetical protein
MAQIIDLYNIRARQFPATVVLAPAIIAAFAILPGLRGLSGMIGGLIATLGLPAALAYLARGAGKGLEASLYEQWGGKPSMAMLRDRDGRLNPVTKRRYHEFLRKIGNLDIPSEEQEQRDYQSADHLFDSASDWLRRRARSSAKFPLIHAENIGYGFARNLLALKPLGIAIAAICALLQLGLALRQFFGGQDVSPEIAISGLFCVAATVVWVRSIHPSWVKCQAEGYAKALLEICDEAPTSAAAGSTRSKAVSKARAASPSTKRFEGSQISEGKR